MRNHYLSVMAIAVAITLSASACSDVAGPQWGPDTNEPLLTQASEKGGKGATRGKKARGPGESIDVEETANGLTLLDRIHPLNKDITVTETITPLGGHIRIPEAGLDVKFPEGAVTAPVEVTVTALKGKKVAYEFGPHGLQFNRPVEFRQEIGRTNVERLIEQWGLGQEYKLSGGYLVPDGLLWGVYFEGTVRDPVILETTRAILKNFWITFEFTHFSGYAIASG